MKVNTRYAVKGVIETTYGSGTPATTSTDGIGPPNESISPALDYLFDGARGVSPLGGQYARAAMAGLGASLDFPTVLYTPGVAYSATVRPNVDRLLRACGFTVTTVLTGGAESHTYTPTNLVSAYESLYLQFFRAGQQYDMKGVFSTLSIAADGLAVPVWTFGLSGIGVRPTEVTVPTDTTYPNVATQKPANALNSALSIGAFTNGVVRGWSFEQQRELVARMNDNSTTGHQGFAPGAWAPQFTVTVEAEALGAIGASTLDPYQMQEAATEFVFSFRHGASGAPGQYKRFTLNMPRAQIIGVNDADDGPLATWELTIAGAVTPAAIPNDMTLVFD